jgi:uncharacterized pyridoxal phosphate-containing UPF0001 family protein
LVKFEQMPGVQERKSKTMASQTIPAATMPLPTGLAAVEQQIARACKDFGRDRASVTLIAVSKTFGADAIAPVIASGQLVFGENRVQEAKAKWPALLAAHPGLVLHLIGPLQSNKAREAVALFDAIHSVDRPSICEALAKEIKSQGRHPQLFVQVNTGEEPQKAGVAPQDATSTGSISRARCASRRPISRRRRISRSPPRSLRATA